MNSHTTWASRLPTHWTPRLSVTRQRGGRPQAWWGGLGLVVVTVGAAMAVFGIFPVDIHGPLHYMGVMDPLCGATRSVVSTFRGQWATAWRYNPLGLPVAALAVAGVLRYLYGAVTGDWLVVQLRPGRLGWIVLLAGLVALQIRQQGRADLLMSSGLR
ncbi:DUF2752 domain-containing protein [Streptomyces sp. RB6PN25]|uniref:DUF2752 domain-containing protein n=1 Tax=Streptomyces humicola TaxID=2953240 RepID=A0ABT1PTF9_9ACTN|nr:DUF2752 domain-containing protein [Streptomyces humicola]MCQ4080936.1 DUF2752 domain-containing protein [Streptomyces humicola]